MFEPNPSFQNLFGHFDTKCFMGTPITDFTMVQAGSMLQANGGYLILEVEPILMDGFTWETLKRTMLNKQLYIQAPPPTGSGMLVGSLRPEPIALDVKIVIEYANNPMDLSTFPRVPSIAYNKMTSTI